MRDNQEILGKLCLYAKDDKEPSQYLALPVSSRGMEEVNLIYICRGEDGHTPPEPRIDRGVPVKRLIPIDTTASIGRYMQFELFRAIATKIETPQQHL